MDEDIIKGTRISVFICLTSDTSLGLIFSECILHCKAKFKHHIILSALMVKLTDIYGNSGSISYLCHVLYFILKKYFTFVNWFLSNIFCRYLNTSGKF